MEKIDQELLIKDICSRLPYGVYVKFQQYDNPLFLCMKDALVVYNGGEMIDTIQYLYLRTMSSMTEEEKKEFQACHCVYELHPDFQPMMCNLANELNMFDWLNAHHFNYRLPPHLFIEAPEGMYKTE